MESPGLQLPRETLTLSESTSRIAAFVIRVSRNTTNGLEQGATGEYTPNNSYSDFAVPQASSAEGNNYLTVTNSDTTNFNVTNIRTVTRFLHPEERLPSDGSYLNQFPAISGNEKTAINLATVINFIPGFSATYAAQGALWVVTVTRTRNTPFDANNLFGNGSLTVTSSDTTLAVTQASSGNALVTSEPFECLIILSFLHKL